MSSRDTKIKQTLLESGLGLLAKYTRKTRITDTHVCTITKCLGLYEPLGTMNPNIRNSFQHHVFISAVRLYSTKVIASLGNKMKGGNVKMCERLVLSFGTRRKAVIYMIYSLVLIVADIKVPLLKNVADMLLLSDRCL